MVMMWMEFQWSVVVAEPPLFRQHFFQFVGVIALGFYSVREGLASFFSVSSTRTAWTGRIFTTGRVQGSDANGDRGIYYFYAAE
jgi:queuine/archaeosine tRNA-ribosyltransferase